MLRRALTYGASVAASSAAPHVSRSFGVAAVAALPEEPVGDATDRRASRKWMEPADMIPRAVVASLDQHIIGQSQAKRAIAVALRNRWRRLQLKDEALMDEVIPKNILMIGPTGCGKTEIARRLAKLCKAPFVKVEATKFTEVGYHGRDVDSIVKDLMDASLHLVEELKTEQFKKEVQPAVEAKLLEALTGPGAAEDTIGSFRSLLRAGALDDREVVVDVPVKEAGGSGGGLLGNGKGGASNPFGGDAIDISVLGDLGKGGPGGSGGSAAVGAIDLGEFMSRIMPGSSKAGGKQQMVKKTLKIKEARQALEEAEVNKRLQTQDLRREAVVLAEQNGIVVIDEIDKIISNKSKHSGDASAEGVQRDLLPLIEGTTVDIRRFGQVKTDYMLFLCAGAFHEHKPSELLAELQGRLPIRVELKGLDANDLERILTDTKFSLLEQQKALLAAEGIELSFTSDAIKEIARLAAEINRQVENIGARRLHTVIEKIMEDISYSAPDIAASGGASSAASAAAPAASYSSSSSSSSSSKTSVPVVVDKELVRQKLLPMLEKTDLAKFIL